MIVVCGEALVDLVGEPDGRTFRARPGGSPANTAVGLARLGTPAALLARLASDELGRLLREHLAASGVDLRLVVHAPEPTTLALATLDELGRAEYTFYVDGCADGGWSPADLPDALPAGTRAVHVSGSLALAVPAMGEVLEAFLARESGRRTVVVDPNVRPALARDERDLRERLRRWLGLADIVKVSGDDLAWLHPGEPVAEVTARWQRLGPPLVAVTLGAGGAHARCGEHAVTLPAEPVEVVDTVGAGDAFTAGLLDWLARHDRLGPGRLPALTAGELSAALGAALHVSGLTCTRPGANPPWRGEL